MHISKVFKGTYNSINVLNSTKLYKEKGGEVTTSIKYYLDTSLTLHNIQCFFARKGIVVLNLPHMQDITIPYLTLKTLARKGWLASQQIYCKRLKQHINQ